MILFLLPLCCMVLEVSERLDILLLYTSLHTVDTVCIRIRNMHEFMSPSVQSLHKIVVRNSPKHAIPKYPLPSFQVTIEITYRVKAPKPAKTDSRSTTSRPIEATASRAAMLTEKSIFSQYHRRQLDRSLSMANGSPSKQDKEMIKRVDMLMECSALHERISDPDELRSGKAQRSSQNSPYVAVNWC